MTQEAITELGMDVFSRRIAPYLSWLESRIESGWEQQGSDKDILKETKALLTDMRARFILGVEKEDFKEEISRAIAVLEAASDAFPYEADEIDNKITHLRKGIAEELGATFLPDGSAVKIEEPKEQIAPVPKVERKKKQKTEVQNIKPEPQKTVFEKTKKPKIERKTIIKKEKPAVAKVKKEIVKKPVQEKTEKPEPVKMAEKKSTKPKPRNNTKTSSAFSLRKWVRHFIYGKD